MSYWETRESGASGQPQFQPGQRQGRSSCQEPGGAGLTLAAPVSCASSNTDSARQDTLSPEPSRSRFPHHRLAIAGASRSSEPRAPRPARDPVRDPPPALPPGPARHRPRRVSCEKASAPETVPGAQGPPQPRPRGCTEGCGSSPARAGESCTPKEQAMQTDLAGRVSPIPGNCGGREGAVRGELARRARASGDRKPTRRWRLEAPHPGFGTTLRSVRLQDSDSCRAPNSSCELSTRV